MSNLKCNEEKIWSFSLWKKKKIKNQCSFYLLLEWNACKCEGSDSLFHCITAKLIPLLRLYKWLQNWRGIVNKLSTKLKPYSHMCYLNCVLSILFGISELAILLFNSNL